MGYCRTEHGCALLDSIQSLHQRNIGCDITLVDADQTSHRAHLLVLSSFSHHFKVILENGLADDTKTYSLPEIQTSIMTKLLDFMYTADINPGPCEFKALLSAATQLGMLSLLSVLNDCAGANLYESETSRKEYAVASEGDKKLGHQVVSMVTTDAMEFKGELQPKVGSNKKLKIPDKSVENLRISSRSVTRLRKKENHTQKKSAEQKSVTTRSGRKLKPPQHLADQVITNPRKRGRFTRKSPPIRETDHTESPPIREADHTESPPIREADHTESPSEDGIDDPDFYPNDFTQEEGDHADDNETVHKKKRRQTLLPVDSFFKKETKTESYTVTKSTKIKRKNLKSDGKKSMPVEIEAKICKSRNIASVARIPTKSTTILKKHECILCQRLFVHSSSAQFHKLWHKPKNTRMRFLGTRQKRGHKGYCKSLTGAGEVPSKLKCTACKFSSPHQNHVQIHFLKVHGTVLQCRFCRKKFTSRRDLVAHRRHGSRQCHDQARARCSLCTLCGRQFRHQVNLDRHHSLIHPDASPDQIATPYPLKCTHCGSQFKYKSAFLTHLSHHGLSKTLIDLQLTNPQAVPNVGNVFPKFNTYCTTKTGPVQCSTCKRMFSSVHNLNQHMLQKHSAKLYEPTASLKGGLRWLCEVTECDFKARTSTQLKSHMEQSHRDIVHMCPSCKYKTPIKQLFDKHMKTRHDKSSDVAKQCEHCNEQFRTNYNLRVHLYYKHNILHPSLKIHRCQQEGCDYFAFQRYIVDVHMSKHKSEKSFECPICSKKLKKEISIQRHIDKVHNRIRPFICEQCGSSYAEESELKTHMARHSKEKPFNCEQCGYSTSDKGTFHSHMWAKHKLQMNEKQRIFQCAHCAYSCDRQCRFDEHMTSHTGVRGFECKDCGKSFLKKSTLRGHKLWVHGEKKVRCDYCDHVTSTMANLREHVRIMHTHRHLKPFQCAYCDFRCQTVGNCKKHISTRHKGLPPQVIKLCDKYPNDSKPLLKAEMAQNPHKNNSVAHFEYTVQNLIESKNTFSAQEEQISTDMVTIQQVPMAAHEELNMEIPNPLVAIQPEEQLPNMVTSEDMYHEFTPVSSFQSLPPYVPATSSISFDTHDVSDADHTVGMVMPPSLPDETNTLTEEAKDSHQASMLSSLLPSMYQIAQSSQRNLHPTQQYLYIMPPSMDHTQNPL